LVGVTWLLTFIYLLLLLIRIANLPVQQNEDALQSLGTGIYYGWARVGSDPTFYKTVLSIGWNPFFQNAQKTIEPYLMATFAQDFYGEQLTVLVTGFLRPELNFPSLEALVEAIHTDIRVAGEELDKPEQVALKATV
jgi:riboflavin kinase